MQRPLLHCRRRTNIPSSRYQRPHRQASVVPSVHAARLRITHPGPSAHAPHQPSCLRLSFPGYGATHPSSHLASSNRSQQYHINRWFFAPSVVLHATQTMHLSRLSVICVQGTSAADRYLMISAVYIEHLPRGRRESKETRNQMPHTMFATATWPTSIALQDEGKSIDMRHPEL